MIEADTIRVIAGKVASQGLSDGTISLLRGEYPAVHFTYCMDNDVTVSSPVLEQDQFNIYLVDGRNHCLCFTDDADVATGLVIAEKEDYPA